jgi:cell wall-associated NlpC family hydrolase
MLLNKTKRMKMFLLLPVMVLLVACSAFKKVSDKPRVSDKPLTLKEVLISKYGISNAEADRRENVVYHSQQYVGTRYRSGGTSVQSGFDCSGFTSFIMKYFDMTIDHSASAQFKNGKVLSVKDAKPGDLVFFSRSGGSGRIFHVALILENTNDKLMVIHSTSSRGVVMEDISKDEYWSPKIVGAADVINEYYR